MGTPGPPGPVRDPRAPWVGRYSEPDYLDDFNDGYAVVPIELPYRESGGQAYLNAFTGLKILHYPVVHTRAARDRFQSGMGWPGRPLDAPLFERHQARVEQIAVPTTKD